MQRKKSSNTRTANSAEKRFMAWVKIQSCVICFLPGPSIVEHMYGSTFKNNKILIGMWALLPYCPEHDAVKTNGSHANHLKVFGFTQASLWLRFIERYPMRPEIPDDVILAIENWGR